jgi:LacI family transcriptional regulator
MNVNIKVLAQELNLSTASVSRALRDSYEISNETKKRVWELAKKLNYEPNPFASNLRRNKSKTIAVIIPEIANNFFSLAINAIEEVARQRDYHVLIYQTHDDTDIEIAFINRLLCGRVDGILISVSSTTIDNKPFSKLIKDIPVVFFDRVYENIDAATITTNDYESSYLATQHLIDCGCKKIAYLFALKNLLTGKMRLNGYLDALKSNHILHDENLVVTHAECAGQDYDNIRNLLITEKPDAVISSIEQMALPCYQACKELDINIPNQLKIISFSNLETAPLLNPSLSTITQPALEIGREAAVILFKILDKKYFESTEPIVLKSAIILRESTGKQ